MKSIKRALGAALGLVALTAAPAHAKPLTPGTCTPAGTVSQAFAAFGDSGSYTAVLNAGAESGTTGWTIAAGAGVVDANEPWFVSGNTADHHAFNLPAGASVTSTPFCVDETFTHFRAFARNLTGKGALRVEILFTDEKGKPVVRRVDDVRGTSAWGPTGAEPIRVVKKAGVSSVPVSFRFTARGGAFQLDDVYIDPWARS